MDTPSPRFSPLGCSTRLVAAAAILFSAGEIPANDELGVSVPEGFEVSLYADDAIAHDIFSLTIDSAGRVVVSGAGYVRILKDTDDDGAADSFEQFADGPQSGAQGMYFYGRDLICAGDGGLIRYRDKNADDRADGPPDLFLKINTGGEHDLHAIRRGPDGWFYMIAGNLAGVDANYASLATSPVKEPNAGVIMRLRPDLTGGEIVADGLRNAYDFDFGLLGDLFTFDSDGERDITLPWYEPTRLYHMTPGSSAGWFSRSWKRPSEFMDMPPTVGAFGRGSPTGIVCYRHNQFPKQYHGALFALDWTYGRVFALPMEPSGSTWTSEPIEFMTAIGHHGFAPTDADIGPDGALYISVGGRGTRGGVYRIRSVDGKAVVPLAQRGPLTPTEKLQACLNAPQPLSSWSRRMWEPVAEDLGDGPFIDAAMSKGRPPAERVRAIEIITEKFQGLDMDLAEALLVSRSPDVRARAVWSLGRTQTEQPRAGFFIHALHDTHPFVARNGLEALLGADPLAMEKLTEPLARCLAHEDLYVRQAAVRVLARCNEDTYHGTAALAVEGGWRAAVPLAQAFALRKPGFNAYAVEVGLRVLEGNNPPELDYEAARLITLGLGDVAPAEAPGGPVFDGYASRANLSEHAAELAPLAERLVNQFPTSEANVDEELMRVLAMIQPENAVLINKVLGGISDESHPTDDLHRLIVLARMPAARTEEQRNKTATALLSIETKVKARNLQQDKNWNERIMELYMALVERDAELPVALLSREEFGEPGHVLFVAAMPEDRYSDALNVFIKRIESDPDYGWTQDVVFLIGAVGDQAVRDMLRQQFDNFALRPAILMTLSQQPYETDRDLFVQGLEGTPFDTMAECIKALALLDPAQTTPTENVALVRAARRLGHTEGEREMRDQIIELLRIRTEKDFGYVLGQEGDPQQASIDQWTAWAQAEYGDEYARQSGTSVESLEELRTLLADVDWDHGDAGRGAKLFQSRQCQQCHSSGTALGPDLTGAAGRFSREDLFTAIALPDRDVSPRYQTTTIVTTDGTVYTGMIVYESVDGIVLRNATNQTLRIEASEIEAQKTLSRSIMPAGLLKDLAPSDLADLYSYLRGMGVRTANSGGE